MSYSGVGKARHTLAPGKEPRGRPSGRVFRVRCNATLKGGIECGVRIITVQALNKDDAFVKCRKLGHWPIALV